MCGKSWPPAPVCGHSSARSFWLAWRASRARRTSRSGTASASIGPEHLVDRIGGTARVPLSLDGYAPRLQNMRTGRGPASVAERDRISDTWPWHC